MQSSRTFLSNQNCSSECLPGTSFRFHSPLQAKISPCGCAGIYSAPVALSVYAKVFEQERSLANLEKFATENGPAFYGLPKNTNEEGNRITLVKEPWVVPQRYRFGSDHVVPLCAGMTLPWKVTRE